MPIEIVGEADNRHIGHVYIDGSSTAYGYGDESGLGGFAGRLKTAYQAYNSLK